MPSGAYSAAEKRKEGNPRAGGQGRGERRAQNQAIGLAEGAQHRGILAGIRGDFGGAVVGGSRKAGTAEENKKANQQWANEQGAEYSQKRSKYNRAYSACLEGKGYTVK